jgi:hypothetical protein
MLRIANLLLRIDTYRFSGQPVGPEISVTSQKTFLLTEHLFCTFVYPVHSFILYIPKFQDNRHLKVVRSAQRNGRLYPPGNIPGSNFR